MMDTRSPVTCSMQPGSSEVCPRHLVCHGVGGPALPETWGPKAVTANSQELTHRLPDAGRAICRLNCHLPQKGS